MSHAVSTFAPSNREKKKSKPPQNGFKLRRSCHSETFGSGSSCSPSSDWSTSPSHPIEVGHNWRQSTVLMVARNFFEGPFDLMHPKVDMAGDLSGMSPAWNFPLLNALHAGCARLLGWSDWYGRLIVLIFSSLRPVEFVLSPPAGQSTGDGPGIRC